jgi:hypothetical protein
MKVCLKLLRMGAVVIATTRFPRDAAERYAQEQDFAEWWHRLHVVGEFLWHGLAHLSGNVKLHTSGCRAENSGWLDCLSAIFLTDKLLWFWAQVWTCEMFAPSKFLQILYASDSVT